jgi:hypothetical protein
MINVVEVGSCALINMLHFISINSGIQKLTREWNTQTYRLHVDLINLLLIFRIRKVE